MHVAKIQGDFPTHIGHGVTVGAGALIHAATLQDHVVIGESAQVLDGSTVEENAVVAPGSIVTPGTTVPRGEYWAGSPAKKVRALTAEEVEANVNRAVLTASLAADHAIENAKSYEQILEEEEIADIKEHLEEWAPRQPETDLADVLGQGQPGRIFRSTLTNPEEAAKLKSKE